MCSLSAKSHLPMSACIKWIVQQGWRLKALISARQIAAAHTGACQSVSGMCGGIAQVGTRIQIPYSKVHSLCLSGPEQHGPTAGQVAVACSGACKSAPGVGGGVGQVAAPCEAKSGACHRGPHRPPRQQQATPGTAEAGRCAHETSLLQGILGLAILVSCLSKLAQAAAPTDMAL